MILLLASVIGFNAIAFKKVKGISKNKIVHIWVFTITFQLFFDIFIDLKYHGYWYFTKAIDWVGIPAYIMLIPPVNLLFLYWFPFKSSIIKKLQYFVIWEILLLIYEVVSQIPHPFGFFHYGWWKLWYSVLLNPILLIILLGYYKWISKLENEVCS
ncbi:hypothetical protein ACFFIX_18605 [Metabacillus herbersteinensis]|uniref:Uncharacterized protein n=1 Tax=Metabacillus herbersteinensis TaxID=283816 RepID=A0ABV6GIR5_9BACI